MKRYTLGVALPDDEHVVMIRKTKPTWQAGLLNFIGGKVEEGESYLDCVVREFHEETGVKIASDNWVYVGKLHKTGDFMVKIYMTVDSKALGVRTTTDEEVVLVKHDQFAARFREMVSNIPTIYNFILSSDFVKQHAELNIRYP